MSELEIATAETTMIINHVNTIVYCDGPQVFIAQDRAKSKFICLLVEYCSDYDTYLCVRISEHRLSSFLNGMEDLLPVYEEPEMGEFYNAKIDNLNIDLNVDLIARTDIPQEWFPGSGFYMDHREVSRRR